MKLFDGAAAWIRVNKKSSNSQCTLKQVCILSVHYDPSRNISIVFVEGNLLANPTYENDGQVHLYTRSLKGAYKMSDLPK